MERTAHISEIQSLIERILEQLPSREKSQLRDQTIRLRSMVHELQLDVSTLLRQNAELEFKLRKAEEALQPGGEPVYAESVYWIIRHGQRDGPYCPNCFDADREWIRLNPQETKGVYKCHRHGTTFRTGDYKRPEMTVLSVPGISSKLRGWS